MFLSKLLRLFIFYWLDGNFHYSRCLQMLWSFHRLVLHLHIGHRHSVVWRSASSSTSQLLGFHKSIQTPINTHNVSYVFWNLLWSKDFKKYFSCIQTKVAFLMQVSTNEYNNGYALMITHTQARLYISTYIYSSALRCDYFCDFVL